MTDPLGLSVGVVNLRAVTDGQNSISRRAVLTLFDQLPPEVGLPEENLSRSGTGLVVGGFVERVGDPAPVVAADGSTYRGEELTADALDALARLTGYGAAVCIAVPAHWEEGRWAALRAAVRSKPGLSPPGAATLVVSDAAAIITALGAEPGLPSRGVVALCDFGGGGTSITLLDAAANYRPVAPTVRYAALSGTQLDQTILNQLLGRLPINGGTDSPGTAAVGSLTQLRDECRAAKERLSERPSTAIPVELPGFSGDVELTRSELQKIIAAPLAGVLDTITDMLSRNSIPAASLTAVALAGGGANIPMVGAQLSERLRVPLVTTSRPGSIAAIGAALLARRQSAPASGAGTGPDEDAPTSMASAGWAAGAAGAAAAESAADGDQSATFRALAWSQDDSKAYEPVPFSGADYVAGDFSGDIDTGHPDEPEPLTWYKRPVLLFALAAALALAATGGLAYTLTGDSRAPDRPAEPPAPTTVTLTAPNGETSLSTIAPPPPPPNDTATESENSSTTAEPSSTATTTTTTIATTTTTTTEQPTTTTQPTSTTTEVSTQPSSSAPPATTRPTQPPAPTTAKPPTTAAPTGSG